MHISQWLSEAQNPSYAALRDGQALDHPLMRGRSGGSVWTGVKCGYEVMEPKLRAP